MSLLGIDQTPEDAARQAAAAKRSNAIFIASLISILFCCLGGIIASIIAHGARTDAEAGNIDSAERKTNIAMGLMIASFVIGVSSVLGRLSQMR
jgi:flagellar basal body-associated protein FliL